MTTLHQQLIDDAEDKAEAYVAGITIYENWFDQNLALKNFKAGAAPYIESICIEASRDIASDALSELQAELKNGDAK